MTFALMPVEVDEQIVYTPVRGMTLLARETQPRGRR